MAWFEYILRYPDLFYSGINSPEKVFQHWKTRGRAEGRQLNIHAPLPTVLYISEKDHRATLKRAFPETLLVTLQLAGDNQPMRLSFQDYHIYVPLTLSLIQLLNHVEWATVFIHDRPKWSILNLMLLLSIRGHQKLWQVQDYYLLSGDPHRTTPNPTILRQLQPLLKSFLIITPRLALFEALRPYYITIRQPPDVFVQKKIRVGFSQEPESWLGADVIVVSELSHWENLLQMNIPLLAAADLGPDVAEYGLTTYSSAEDCQKQLEKYERRHRSAPEVNLKWCSYFQPRYIDRTPRDILYPGESDFPTIRASCDPRILALVNHYLINTTLYLRREQPPQRNKDRDRAAVIIEPRKHFLLEAVIRNVLYNLNHQWDLVIFTHPGNFAWLRRHLVGWELDLRPTPDNLPFAKYNAFLLSAEFWKSLAAEHILLFQTDSFMLRSDPDSLAKFLDYPIIGARQKCFFKDTSHLTPRGHGINGGFSLRQKSRMLQALTLSVRDVQNYRLEHKMEPTHEEEGQICEDIFFTHALEMLKVELPNADVLDSFCVQDFFSLRALALHGFNNVRFSVKEFFELLAGYGIAY